jgi:EEF1A lysine methyltransferase 1
VTDCFVTVYLFEYDDRFAVYDQHFVQYDYTKASMSNYLDQHINQFDIIILDPPFLSEECIENMSKIIKKVATQDAKIVLCSGKKVKDWAKTYLDLDQCKFEPEHERNLGNEFASYANFDLDEFIES